MAQEQALTDAEAVRAVLGGQRDAFAVLVYRHLPTIRALALSRTSNHADAEDVTQETLLRAFKYLDTLRDASRFGSWVAMIAQNVARKVLAQRLKRARMAEELYVVERPPPRDVEDRDMRRFLCQQIDELDDAHRDVLFLYYFSGMTLAEVASVLTISHAAAKKRLQRARAALGRQLAGLVGEEPRAMNEDERRRQTRKIMGLLALTVPEWRPVARPSPDALPLASAGGRQRPRAIVAGALASLLLAGAGAFLWLAANRHADEGVGRQTELRVAEEVASTRPEPETPTVDAPATDQTSAVGGGLAGGGGDGRGRAMRQRVAAPELPETMPAMAISPGHVAHEPGLERGGEDDALLPATDGYVGNVKLDDVPLGTVLDVTLRQLNLDYTVRDGHVWISTPEQIRREAAESQ